MYRIFMNLLALISLIIAFVAIYKVRTTQLQLKKLNQTVDKLARQLEGIPQKTITTMPDTKEKAKALEPVEPQKGEKNFTFSLEGGSDHSNSSATVEGEPPPQASRLRPTKEQIKSQWMVWLGGACVALSGIFLVKYSMEQGYLGAKARIGLGLSTGILLHIAAEWWRRKNAERYDSVAALSGAASITLYAALLAAHHLYHLWPPLVIFGCLIAVSLATMWLALLHGPVIAIIGILGAYLVPILVETGSHSIDGALIYSLIVSASAFLLMRFVFRNWLWWSTMAGGLAWFILSFMQYRADHWNAIYLTIFAYQMLTLRHGDFFLRIEQQRSEKKLSIRDFDCSFIYDLKFQGLLILIIAQGLIVASTSNWTNGVLQWLPLIALVILAARRNPNLLLLPWFTLLVHAGTIIFSVHYANDRVFSVANQSPFMLFLAAMALTFSLLSFLQRRRSSGVSLNRSLTWLAPLISLSLVYICQPQIRGDLRWTLWTLLLGAIYGALAAYEIKNRRNQLNSAWLIIATHAAYSLAVVIILSQATLTLALAAQVISLSWIGRRVEIAHIDYVIKGIVAVVVVRLTLNPWVMTYPEQAHWSLWTYGGSCAAMAVGALLCTKQRKLRPWLEGATIHLLVLFINMELRYQLYDGEIFKASYSFTEAAINTNLWASLALVYHYRSRLSSLTRQVYEAGAWILMGLAVANYLIMLSVHNPLFFHESGIGAQPILNILLVAYAIPVLAWAAASRYFFSVCRKGCQILAGFGLWFAISLEIRHLWLAKDASLQLWDMTDGELYSYSLAWLLMGGTAFIIGIVRQHKTIYLSGLILLGLVISKIFLIDMKDLEGILRVISFMGLGLCLLGLAFLHQYIDRKRESA
jgi:uncharacterized membrane protein